MVYLLALLGVAFGAVSLLVYRTTKRTLEEKKTADAKLINTRFDSERRKLEDKLDKDLLEQAEKLSLLVFQEWDEIGARPVSQAWQSAYLQRRLAAILGPFMAKFTLNGQEPPWASEWKGATAAAVDPKQLKLIRIGLEEEDVSDHIDASVAQYFQVDHSWGGRFCSKSLAGRSLPFNPDALQEKLGLDWKAEAVLLDSGAKVRRVFVKTTPAKRGPRRPFGPPPGPPKRPEGVASPRRPRVQPPPWPTLPRLPRETLYIQVAVDAGKNDAALAELEAARAEKLHDLDLKMEASLASLRNHLLIICLATFAATVLGGVWLVRLGLSPLHKLSEAVSKVSTKDFRLPLEEKRLPGELEPIVARLTETLELLKRAFAREKQAAADISHELRTPLAALLTTIDVSLRKTRTPDEYQETLIDCRASGKQMHQLVERLLTLARLDAGVDRLRPREVDAAELADECAALVRPLAEARGVELQVHNHGPARLQADPDKLREVVTNLLHNAIQYNRPQGSVELRVARNNGHVGVQVKDTGIGISCEARQHIFERFYRADPSRHADGLHAGLGLAIVKGYVDLMGGNIAVESAEGQGSTFRVELPVG
jgi:heavy metal sensor kinase